MLHSLQEMLAPGALERITLFLNHVLSSEDVAVRRLQAHAGRRIELELVGWPSLLPALPPLLWRVTPAGLLERAERDAGSVPELTLRVEASNPARLFAQSLGGTPPAVQVDGDAQFAGDVNWLIGNLRWDVAADLERFVGPTVGHALHRFGTTLAAAARTAMRGAAQVGERWRQTRP